MVRGIFIGLIMIATANMNAQCDNCDTQRKGLLRAGAGLSLDNLTSYNYSVFSGNGNLEYYVSDKVSFRSEVYLHLGNLKEDELINIQDNHQLLVGFNYHFKQKGEFDPYLGAQIGVATTRIGTDDPVIAIVDPLPYGLETDPTVNSVAQLNAGFNYYAAKYFHLFMDVSYNMQSHNTALNPSMNLNALRFKFGLGWHLQTQNVKALNKLRD